MISDSSFIMILTIVWKQSGEVIKDWNADSVQFLQNTMPFDDTVPLEDVFETQLVNLGGETQVLDDHDFTENISTQFLDEFDDGVVSASDGEGTDRTEVLSNNEGLSDNDSVRNIDFCPVDKENVPHVSGCEEGEKGSLAEPHSVISAECNAGISVLNSTAIKFIYYLKILMSYLAKLNLACVVFCFSFEVVYL